MITLIGTIVCYLGSIIIILCLLYLIIRLIERLANDILGINYFRKIVQFYKRYKTLVEDSKKLAEKEGRCLFCGTYIKNLNKEDKTNET